MEVFASVVNVRVAFPKPELLDSVSHETSEEAAQERFDVTVIDLLSLDEEKDSDSGETLKKGVAPSCMTLTV